MTIDLDQMHANSLSGSAAFDAASENQVLYTHPFNSPVPERLTAIVAKDFPASNL